MPNRTNRNRRRRTQAAAFFTFAVAAAPLALLSPAVTRPARAQQTAPAAAERAAPFDFYVHKPYRASVPRPSDVLGYEPGDRHSTFRDQERYLLALATAAPDRVRVEEYGTSIEGRPLRLFIVSSPANIARLDAIRGDIAKLADPRTLGASEADAVIARTPTITWINECIHGSETASFETAMWTLYTLAASDAPDVADALQNSVVIVNPVFNPDGHERFVVYNNSVAVGSPEGAAFEKQTPWAVAGRYNHYRFDMNRDKLAQSQPELRQETRAFLRWRPQVFADQHGQPETYFFPPNSNPTNKAVDIARVAKWTDVFGRANGAAFDARGWQYVTRETFDLFYPGYLDSFTTLTGSIGMTYETDGGGSLARRRDDGTISTLRDGTARHFVTGMATIEAAAQNRAALLRDFYAFRKGAIEAGRTGDLRRVIIAPGTDPARADELASLLLRIGVEVRRATAPFTTKNAHAYLPATGKAAKNAGSRTFPAGSLVIEMAQPDGHLARAFLEPDAPFDRAFVREQLARRERNDRANDAEPKEDYDFYDTTAWSLPYTFDADAAYTSDTAPVASEPLALGADGVALAASFAGGAGGVSGAANATAFLFPFDRDAAALVAVRLENEGFRVAVAQKPLRADGRMWPRGTFVVRANRNAPNVRARLDTLARAMNVSVTAVRSGYSDDAPVGLGSASLVSLAAPRVAVVAGDNVDITSYGATWYVLDNAHIPFTSLSTSRLRAPDLYRYNVVIFPDGFGYASALGKDGLAGLKAWIGQGGVAIGLGGGGTWMTAKDADISSASPVGADASADKPAGASADDKAAKPKKAARPTYLPGAIFQARINSEHFLGYGYPGGKIAVPLSGSTFLKKSDRGANAVTFGVGPSRLSGWTWPGNTEDLLANTAYVVDEPLGAGHAIIFLEDPNFRALWPGLRRLFLSAILFGPSPSASGPSGAAANSEARQQE